MEGPRRVRAITYTSLWVILVAAFLWVSAPKIFRSASKNSIYFVGPFHSTDSFLHFDTGETNGSERLIALFESIPASESVLIVVHSDERRSSFIGMIVAYLAWPHPVQIVDLTGGDGGKKLGALFHLPAACVFCRVTPPPGWQRGERFGQTMEVFTARKVVKR